jgi:hypothetical protein
MSKYIEIHGQNDNQLLLNENYQAKYLDDYCTKDIKLVLNKYSKLYKRYKEINTELEDNLGDDREKERKLSLLQYEFEEIEKAIGYAESYDAISFDSRYKPCWLSEIDNRKTYSIKHNEKSYYETLMDHLTANQYFERFQDNEKFSLIVAAIRKHIEAKPI